MRIFHGDLSGKQFGAWRVVRRAPASKPRFYKWTCECVCGVVKDVWQGHLTRHASTSCGCLSAQRAKVRQFKGAGRLHAGYVSRFARGARYRNLTFDVSADYLWDVWLLQDGKCALSGIPLLLPSKLTRTDIANATASLDRVDNTKGYIPDNVRWTHKHINVMRNRLADAEFVALCRAVAAHAEGR